MKKQKPLLPVNANLPEQVLLDDGTMFVTLRTLDRLETFWQEHKNQFEFAGEGQPSGSPIYLRQYEWIFGTTKSSVVRRVMRWAECEVSCEFDNWAKRDPAMHASFFRERDGYRDAQIEKGIWTDKDERAYQTDCVRRSPETYRGSWKLKNLPCGCDPLDWFCERANHEELFDPKMRIAEVERTLQEQTFDDQYRWGSGGGEVHYHDHTSIEATILYWQGEKCSGQDYYGCENECRSLGNEASVSGSV